MINLTPHTVTVRDASGVDHVYPPSGMVARVEMKTINCSPLGDGTPTSRVEYGAAELPELPIPVGLRRVESSYYGNHEERGDGDEVIFVRADSDSEIVATHGSSSRTIRVDGVEYRDEQCDDIVADFEHRCIVSTMFADAYRRTHRRDGVLLLVPDSGPSAIRENGQIVAVTSLIRR